MANALHSPIRLAIVAVLAMLTFLLPASAQNAGAVIGVSVSASVKGATFWVDGKEYVGAASFAWPQGSKHILEVRSATQPFGDGRSRVAFQGWQLPGETQPQTSSQIQVFTADPANTSITANFALQHRVNIYVDFDPLRNLLDPTAIDLKPISSNDLPLYANKSGYVWLSGTAACGGREGLPTSTWIWYEAGSALQVAAFPYPGSVFTGWQMPPGPGSSPGSLIVTGPLELRARFAPARRIHLDSFPVKELKVLVDHASVPTRGDKCWPDWSNFYSPNTPVPPAPPDYNPPGAGPMPASSYCTQLPLCNGDREFEPGTAHVFAAPPSQTDRLGNLWVFDHWNFGGDKTGGQNSTVIIPADWQERTYTAHFVKGIRSSFLTSPVGLKLKIDGRDNWPAYNFEWGLGHKHTVSAPLEQTDTKGRRYRFVGWSNEGPADQEVTITEEPSGTGSFRMIARYEPLGQLACAVSRPR